MNEETKNRLKAMGIGKVVETVEKGNCPFCGEHVNLDEFRDELSRKEFQISGICQKCQDDFFGK